MMEGGHALGISGVQVQWAGFVNGGDVTCQTEFHI